MNTLKLALFTFIIASACMDSLATNIYKWTDKEGVVHYSQNAPKDQQAEIITTKTPRTSLPDTSPAINESTTPNTTESVSADDKKADKPPATVVTKDKATCDSAIKAIQTLQRPVVKMDGKVMTIDEKNEQLRTQEEIKKVHCP